MDTNVNTVAPGAETPAALSNDKRYAEARNKAKKLGENKAKGLDALPLLSQGVVNWAYEGIIDDKTKVKSKIVPEGGKAEMISHIQDIFEAYSLEEGKAVHERSKASVKVQISKLNAFFRLGTLPNVDGPAVWQRAYEMYQSVNGKKRHEDAIPAYDYYIKVAVWQTHKDNRDTPIDDKKLMELMMKGEKGPKDLGKELKRALDILDSLVEGTGDDGLQDSDPLTKAARDALIQRINKLTKDREIATLRAKLAAHGVAV